MWLLRLYPRDVYERLLFCVFRTNAKRDSASSSIKQGDAETCGGAKTSESAQNHVPADIDEPSGSTAQITQNGEPNPTNDGDTDEKNSRSSFSEPQKDDAPPADTESETAVTLRDSEDALVTGAEKTNNSATGIGNGLDDEIDDIHNYRLLERYFYKIHAPLIYRFRIPIVIFFAILFVRFDVTFCRFFISRPLTLSFLGGR